MGDITIHLYETQHIFLDGTSANLIPTKWNKFTVSDGNALFSNTILPLISRDVYLAEQIGILKYNLDNKYQSSDTIFVNDEEKTISIIDYTDNYIFQKPLVKSLSYDYTTQTNKTTLSILLSNSNNNKLYFNEDNALSYQCNQGTSSESTKEIHNIDYDGGLTPDSDKTVLIDNQLPGIIVISDHSIKIHTKYTFPTIDGEDNVSVYTETISSKEGHPTVTSYSNITTSTSSENEDEYNINLDDRTVFNKELKTSGFNYITTGSDNMCPTGVLYFW